MQVKEAEQRVQERQRAVDRLTQHLDTASADTQVPPPSSSSHHLVPTHQVQAQSRTWQMGGRQHLLWKPLNVFVKFEFGSVHGM